MKREVAAGTRSQESASVLVEALAKMENVSIGSREKQSLKQMFESGRLTNVEYSAVREFNQVMPLQTGTDPLDILLARRIIDRDQFEVALDFTECWCAYIGRPWPKGWRAERQAPDHNGVSEEHLKRMGRRYWNCLAAMQQVNRSIFPLICDVIVHGKTAGMIADILRFDILRQDFDGGGLITRTGVPLSPLLRSRIGNLVKGLDIIADTPRGDYTREAESMIEQLRAKAQEDR